MTMGPHVQAEIRRIADDRLSGATTLVSQGVAILRGAGDDRAELAAIADALMLAQPSMAGFRTVADLVRASRAPQHDLERLAHRLRRAPVLIARIAIPLITLRMTTGVLRVVTCSRSAAVEQTLLELARTEPAQISCAESRPRREGVALAEVLAAAGVSVTICSDAGIGSTVAAADAVVVGADAVSRAGFVNKVGTAGLVALARTYGIPVFVLAGQEKVLSEDVFLALPLIEGPADELVVPAGISVANPYFERIPAGAPDIVVTDVDARPYEALTKHRQI
jgi:ribose 1,5-bisphosphate isomerase